MLLRSLALLFVLLCLAPASAPLYGQFAPYSPRTVVHQEVGFANAKLEYGRPLVRGREVFGALVPYDSLWVPGVGGTIVTFDAAVEVAGFAVPAGAYVIQIFPRPAEWTLVLSRAEDGIGIYDARYDVVNVCLPVRRPARFYEAYTAELEPTPTGATLFVSWADAQVSVPVTTDARSRELAYVDSLLAGAAVADAHRHHRAAHYLLFTGQDASKALQLLDLPAAAPAGLWGTEVRLLTYLALGDAAAARQTLRDLEALLAEEISEQGHAVMAVTNQRLAKYGRRVASLE